MCDCDFDVRVFLCSEDEGLVLLGLGIVVLDERKFFVRLDVD